MDKDILSRAKFIILNLLRLILCFIGTGFIFNLLVIDCDKSLDYTFNKTVRRQMVVDKFNKNLRDTFNSLQAFIYHFLHKSQSTILCPS